MVETTEIEREGEEEKVETTDIKRKREGGREC